MKSFGGRTRLDQFSFDIEFLLISVVQGVALAALATSAVSPIADLNWLIIPYVISAFLVIIIFWSQAIIHAVSFIDWPLDLIHNFLYFLASFVQVLAFSRISDPLHWFSFMTALFIVAGLLYFVDYGLIKKRKLDFEKTKQGTTLYKDIITQHVYEMKFLVPTGIIFNLLAAFIVWKFGGSLHLFLITVQIIFQLSILINSLHSFKRRSRLIAEMVE